MTQLYTKRLVIADFSLADAPFVLELVNTPTWKQHIGHSGIDTLQAARTYIQKGILESYEMHGYGLYKMSLLHDGTPIGMCGIVKRDWLPQPDLGFAILPEYANQGYTMEASVAVLAHAFETFGLKELLAITTAENEFSIKLLTRLSFTHVGQKQNKTDLLEVYGLASPATASQSAG